MGNIGDILTCLAFMIFVITQLLQTDLVTAHLIEVLEDEF